MTKQKLDAEIAVEGGVLDLAVARVPFAGTNARVAGSRPASAEVSNGEATVRFESPVKLARGQKLTFSLA